MKTSFVATFLLSAFVVFSTSNLNAQQQLNQQQQQTSQQQQPGMWQTPNRRWSRK